MAESTVTLQVSDRIATITLNRPKTLNALTPEGSFPSCSQRSRSNIAFVDYDCLANTLRDLDTRDDVLVTILQGMFLLS